MAGSTSAPPDDVPRPVERTIASIAEQVEAIDAIVDRARSRLRVFDVDLSQGGWHTADRGISLSDVAVGGINPAKSRICAVVPSIVLTEAIEVVARHDDLERLTRLLPHAQVSTLPDCGHFANVEQPRAVLGRIIR